MTDTIQYGGDSTGAFSQDTSGWPTKPAAQGLIVVAGVRRQVLPRPRRVATQQRLFRQVLGEIAGEVAFAEFQDTGNARHIAPIKGNAQLTQSLQVVAVKIRRIAGIKAAPHVLQGLEHRLEVAGLHCPARGLLGQQDVAVQLIIRLDHQVLTQQRIENRRDARLRETLDLEHR